MIVKQRPAYLRGRLNLLAAAGGRGFQVRFGVCGNWPSLNVYKVAYLSDYAQLVDLFPNNSLAAAAGFARTQRHFHSGEFYSI